MKSISAIIAAAVMTCGGVAGVSADTTGSSLDFAVVVILDDSALPDSLKQKSSDELAFVLFDIEDIHAYDLSTHTFRLKPETVERISRLTWWKNIERRSFAQSFVVRVDGEVVYRGHLSNCVASSQLPPVPGPYVAIPLFLCGDNYAISVGMQTDAVKMLSLSSHFEDLRGDARIIEALRGAGVLVERSGT